MTTEYSCQSKNIITCKGLHREGLTHHGGPGSDSDTSRCELRGHASGAPLRPLSARIGLELHHVRDLKEKTK